MSSNTIGIILGGVLPAFLYGVFPLLVKLGNQHHLSPGALILCAGLAAAMLGAVYMLVFEHGFGGLSLVGGSYGLLAGLSWGLGALLVSYAIATYGTPVAVLTPLFNMNTLVAVLLGMVIFAEWKTLQVSYVVTGAILIVVGGIVISRA